MSKKPPITENTVGTPRSPPWFEATRLAGDLSLLATLPATWLDATPRRIGESLLAALDATVSPALSYFRFRVPNDDRQPGPVEVAHVIKQLAPSTTAAELGERILAWTAAPRHPDESLVLADSPAGVVRVWIHALDRDAGRAVLAVGYPADHGPTDVERLVLTMTASQAFAACTSAVRRERADDARRKAQALDETGEALRASEERYRRLTELLPVGVYTCAAPLGTITYFNAAAAQIWGRAPRLGDTDERFCGSLNLYLPDGTPLPHDACPMAVALREGREFRNEEVVVERPDGSRVTALVNIDPIFDANGNITGVVNVFHDISAVKHAEQALREQKDNLETLLETLPVGVLIAHDPLGQRIVGNRAASELLRMDVGDNLSKSAPADENPSHFQVFRDGKVIPPEELPVQRAARGEVVTSEEVEQVFADGTVMHVLLSARPLYDAVGQPRGAVATILDITSRKAAERALLDSDRRKDEFLATLAHELRNPLAPIRSALELMQLSDDRRSLNRARGIIERQVDHLVRLVEDLLDVSRITRDRLELRKTTVDLRAVLHQAVETCRPLAEREQQTLQLELPAQPLFVDGDPIRLAQVFGNLLNNACKYTPGRGTIRLSAQLADGELCVSVADDGIGIPAAALPGIFDMFSQVEHGHERSRGGLGIGLTLVKRLVEMHGGRVSAHSEGVSRGSRFVVRLPSVVDAADHRAASAAAPRAQPTLRRILVVDDNRDAAETLGMLLELEGHEIRLAYDGLEAVEAAEQFRPQLVLLDLGLPRLSGLDACRRIRQTTWGKEMKVVALSGWGQAKDRRNTEEAGFDDHLLKPVNRESLTGVLLSFGQRDNQPSDLAMTLGQQADGDEGGERGD